MKVTGFSFIKNAVQFQYPIVEAIQSILPFCDDVIVVVGNSSDGTRELVAAIDPKKIRIIDSVWDNSLKDGRVLAVETDKAFKEISANADWCFYIQGDEVVHEDGYEEIVSAMTKWKDAKEVDGLLFKYRHFYGSYDYTGLSSRWYKNEIRIIKNDKNIFSYRDAQGFRKGKNEKLKVKPLNAYIHHYGWVREPKTMLAKKKNFENYYQAGSKIEIKQTSDAEFDYNEIDALEKFTGTHPGVMQLYINNHNWQFNFDPSYNKISLKDRFKNSIEKVTGKRPFDYNNYKII
ncbi:MAG: glycosyltransferase family 2 protein [Bacteroidota bacterium]|nr:glycosyltransferase family 2 protein [Bacteroidota bacterium]